MGKMTKVEKLTRRFSHALVKLDEWEIFGVLRILDIKIEEDEDFLSVFYRAQEKFKRLGRVQRLNLLNIVESAAEGRDFK